MSNDLQGHILSAEDSVDVHCTCCHKTVMCTSACTFNCDNYDFSEYIASCALSHNHRLKDGVNEFMCKTCHKRLKSTDSKPPKLPWNAAAHSITKPGYKFLQVIHEKTRICLHMLQQMAFL